jgi:hypothetical protein
MSISVFLSYPKPHMQRQHDFVGAVVEYLSVRGFEPRTLGVTDYDMDAPLTAIRRLMLESNGLISIALGRTRVEKARVREGADIPGIAPQEVEDQWLTSPYCHIEPAMAFQLGLPILLFREKGVVADGILERGVTGTYLPEFDLVDAPQRYLRSPEWNQLIGIWEGKVRRVCDGKGRPPSLY